MLFSKKKAPATELSDCQEETAYEQAINYLIGLSDKEYSQVIKVADIHRKANQEAAVALGVTNEPSTFINEPVAKVVPLSELKLDFLDMPLKKKTKKATK